MPYNFSTFSQTVDDGSSVPSVNVTTPGVIDRTIWKNRPVSCGRTISPTLSNFVAVTIDSIVVLLLRLVQAS